MDKIKIKSILQQPTWPNKKHYHDVINKISTYPPIVFCSEIENLKIETNVEKYIESFSEFEKLADENSQYPFR